MNKLLGVLLIATTCCVSAIAQEENTQSNVTASEIRARLRDQTYRAVYPVAGLKLVPEFSLVNGLPQTRTTTEGKDPGERNRQGDVLLLPWVWKEGALYLDISVFGNGMLIPVPGGGASGCFGPSLPERIEKVGTSIGAFPPRPLPVTPPRQ